MPSDAFFALRDFFSALRAFLARFSSGVSSLCFPFDFDDFLVFLRAFASLRWAIR
jgi:hypothetical protein